MDVHRDKHTEHNTTDSCSTHIQKDPDTQTLTGTSTYTNTHTQTVRPSRNPLQDSKKMNSHWDLPNCPCHHLSPARITPHLCVHVHVHTHVRRAASLQALFKWLWNCAPRTDGLRDKAARRLDGEQAADRCHGRLDWQSSLISQQSEGHRSQDGLLGRGIPPQSPRWKDLQLHDPILSRMEPSRLQCRTTRLT